jgi:protein-S-isoprenylcysteine O-methyltransferase Ste14
LESGVVAQTLTAQHNQTAGVIAPPPLIYVGGFLLGWLLERRWPVAYGLIEPLEAIVGWLLVAGGIALFVAALVALRRVRTSVNPYTPTAAIATAGPYRFSRNPIYLADILIYVGATALFNSPWPLLLLPAVVWIIQRGVIQREERYLTERFGNLYAVYTSRVRRWL